MFFASFECGQSSEEPTRSSLVFVAQTYVLEYAICRNECVGVVGECTRLILCQVPVVEL